LKGQRRMPIPESAKTNHFVAPIAQPQPTTTAAAAAAAAQSSNSPVGLATKAHRLQQQRLRKL
jgi:hypothetical protein